MKQEETQEKQTQFCPHCGQENESGHKFCTSCGQSLASHLSPKKKGKKWKWLLIVLLILLLIGSGAVGIYWYQQEQKRQDEIEQLDKEIAAIDDEKDSESSEDEETWEEEDTKESDATESDEVSAEELSSSEEQLLAASILYAEANPPGDLWGEGLEFGVKAKGTKSETPEYFKEGGSYSYSFEARQSLGSGGWPAFVPSDDLTEVYFYVSGGIPQVDDEGNPYMADRDSLDKVSADELANFINDNDCQEEYEDIASRMVIE